MLSSHKKEVWVVGHKNPDTDSICSAIAYAAFKNKTEDTDIYIPKRAGSISDETRYVLNYFDIKEPKLVLDARPQLYNSDIHELEGISPNASVMQAYETAQQYDIVTIPVVEDGRLCGLVTVGDLCRYVFSKLKESHLNKNVNSEEAFELLSEPVKHFMKNTEDLVTFLDTDYVDDILSTIAEERYRYFPVVDDKGYLLGIVSKGGMLRYSKKQIVLVDHDEKAQAVDGVDSTEILEIIDHHRLGGMSTIAPLFMRVQPVGCTCTIIYQMYCENNIEIDKQTAGLLVSAIISDTLLFRSPTCTEADKKAAEALADIAEINLEKYAKEMFKAGSNLESKTAAEILSIDCKQFETDSEVIAVAQVSTVNSDEIGDIADKVSAYMDEYVRDKGLSKAYLMITDILSESSSVVCAGAGAIEFAAHAFKAQPDGNILFLPGVVSRKKQIVPVIMGALK